MSPRPLGHARSAENADDDLVALCAELLDAHADTIGLAAGRPLGERWEAHLDYLRALQRVGYAIQARTCRQEAS